MEIKILAFISLTPLLFTVYKIIRRDDFNLFDLLSIFHSSYFCIIPLFANVDGISYSQVKNSSEIQSLAFFFYNIFAYLLLILNYRYTTYKRREIGITNITQYIRIWYNSFIPNNLIFYFLVLIVAFLWIQQVADTERTLGFGLGSMQELREKVQESKSPLTLMTRAGATLLRPYCLFFITILWLKKKSIKKKQLFLLKGLTLITAVLYLQISRTYILEGILIIGLVIYSIRKKEIYLKHLLLGSVSILIVVTLLFPLVTVFRSAKRFMIANEHITTIDFPTLVSHSYKLIRDGDIDISEADNKSERSWGVFQNFALSFAYDYHGNGELTKEAILYGVPSIIYNGDKLGSQLIIEKELRVNTDLADSVLLFTQMENKYLAPLYAIFIFLFLIYLWKSTMLFFLKKTQCILLVPLFITSLFIIINRIEMSPDGYLNYFIQTIIWSGVLYFVILILRHIKIKN